MPSHERHLRRITSGNARVRVTIHTRKVTRRPTTRMAQESQHAVIPQIVFPDNETFVAADVDFAALFPASLPRFATIKRFSCTRCQLSQVPTALYEIKTLTEVNLSGNSIDDVPVQFEGSAITKLDLTKNNFEAFPVEVWTMSQLRVLDLSGNSIQACESPAISAAGKAAADGLQSLTLDDNPIAVFNCRFPGLQTLSLQNTSLSTLPRVLTDLINLTHLDLSRNPSLTLSSNETLTLSNLRELDLSSNDLETLPTVLQAITPNLESLTLSSNSIHDDGGVLAAASSLSDLRTLVLDDNQIVNATSILSQLLSLTNLSVVRNDVTEFASPESIDSLRFLNASGNSIKSFKLIVPNLETLDLSNNTLSSVPEAIFALKKLDVLDLSGNPIEPFEVTPSQFTFLSDLKKFDIEQTAFASCSVDRQRDLHGIVKVCVSSSSVTTPSQPSPSASPNPSDASPRTSTADQLLYLGGSFFLAILIALWIYAVRRRRAQAAEAAASNMSASPSPIRRELSDMRSPLVSDPHRHSHRSIVSRGSGQSSQMPVPVPVPLPISSPAREESNHTTFWEDEELQAWRVEFDGVKTQTRIAVGMFAEVWRASYRTDTVAVKKLKSSIRLLHQHHPEMLETGVLDDFIFEIRVLSRLNHPRIIAFYGAAWTNESELTAIMEYMPQQDLRGFLNQRRQSQQHRYSNDSREGETSWPVEIVHMVLCVAEALTYLHAQEPPLIHGNVQAKNVLLDEHMDSKLCDFGSAQYCSVPLLSFSDRGLTGGSDDASPSSSLASVRADATPWIPPEVLRSQAVCDPSIDMYSFGVLLAEIDTNEIPYDGTSDAASLNDLEVRHQVAIGALRPSFTASCPLNILAIASKCLAFEPQDRPTSTDVVFALREIMVASGRQSQASITTQARSTIVPLLNLPSTDSSVSDSDMSQHTIEFRRYSSA